MARRRWMHSAGVLLVLLAAPAARAAGCETPISDSVRTLRLLVDSLRDGKASSQLVDSDGRTYSLAEASWMREQLRLIGEACSRGGEVEAAWRVEALLEATRSRPLAQRQSSGPCQAAPTLTEACAASMALRGRRTVKVDPAPSRLSTSMLPPWSDSTIATR